MALRNLHDFIEETINGFDVEKFERDIELPEEFKTYVSTHRDGGRYTFNRYSAIIRTNLSIYCPNQWFYIASYYCKLYPLLREYREKAIHALCTGMGISEQQKVFENVQGKREQFMALFDQAGYDAVTKDYLWKFVSDYSWWKGGKGIERQDFYYSPILSSAKLVNASQSYVAEISKYLIENPEALQILQNEISKFQLQHPIVNKRKLTEFILGAVHYFDGVDGLDALRPYDGATSPIKMTGPDFSLTGMFIETNLEDIRIRNQEHIRWFEDAFKLGDKDVFLSTQWNATGNYQLVLGDFINLIKTCYGDDYYYKQGPNGEYQLWLKKNPGFEGPRQKIAYGAPGTGKSRKVKDDTEKYEVVRTTFHPDSDYSTFVGAYKPTMKRVEKKEVIHGSESPIKSETGDKAYEEKIVYRFVEQSFLKAYVKAWQIEDPVFLVIEEINRGNCAQIFGDLFQLLDRDENGFSEYSIDADTDLQQYLEKTFSEKGIRDNVPDDIKNGIKLMLPGNLYIWATMNTSDQSLFPIDSAFKRRWEWQYVPIEKGVDKNTHLPLDWNFEVNGKNYDWWEFLKTINRYILSTTRSEDKQLGYFFCKAEGNTIKSKTFINKVIFYLWNDVFKDYGFKNEIFTDHDDKDDSKLSFAKFFTADADKKAEMFLANLGLEPKTNSTIEQPLTNPDDNTPEEPTNPKDLTKYRINGSGTYSKRRCVIESFGIYWKDHMDEPLDDILNVWNSFGVKGYSTILTTDISQYKSKDGFKEFTRNNETERVYLYVQIWNNDTMNDFIEGVHSHPEWNINISAIEE